MSISKWWSGSTSPTTSSESPKLAADQDEAAARAALFDVDAGAAKSALLERPVGPRPGHLGNLSDEQQEKLDQFLELAGQHLLFGPEEDERYKRAALRFLRADNWKVAAAVKRAHHSAAWRERVKPFDIPLQDLETELQTGKVHWYKWNRLGEQTLVVHAAKHVRVAQRHEHNMKLNILFAGRVFKMLPPDVERFSLLFDFHGWSVTKNNDTQLVKEVLVTLQEYFPGRLGHVYLVNAPWTISVVWKIIRPLMSAETKENIVFIRGEDWQEQMLRHFEPQNLLKQHGGHGEWTHELGQHFLAWEPGCGHDGIGDPYDESVPFHT